MIFTGICVRTKDVQRLSDFYKKVLQTTSNCDDAVHQEIATQGAALAILKVDIDEDMCNNNISLAFTVDDVDIEFERLKQLDIEIIAPPTIRPWGAKNMMFADPDGNDVVFRSFPK